ncbi:MAG: ABC transporter permease [Verrucomicrobia bacterium]|nr:ABC transporter permease [Verrucomicrobiota bacterium]
MNDLKFAFRQLLKRPGGAAIILATLALVIGTMSLAFGVIQHELAKWMPFPQPGQMVRLWQFGKERPAEHFPAAVYAETTGRIQGLEAIAGLGGYGSQVLTGEGEPRSLSIQHVTASVFKVAGVQPLLGRWFTAEEQRAGREDLLVISHGAWQSEFQGDESVIGKVVRLNEAPCTIIGVMPAGFERNALFYGLDGWLPKDFESPSQHNHWIHVVGRRKPTVPTAQLNAEVGAVMPSILANFRTARGWETEEVSVRTLPLNKRPESKDAASIVSGASISLFVVAIAVFNVANILLGRILNRRHEFAVRFSLGAGRRRIVRQLLTESLLLSFLGAGAGVIGAMWVAGWAAARGLNAQFSPAVLGWTALAAAVIGVAVGWLPAWRATKGNLLTDLKAAGGTGAVGGSGRHRLRNFLVIGQVAMATSLCLAAGLLVRSYFNKQRFDPGFDTRPLITVGASLNQQIYGEPEKRLLFTRQALDQIRALPGVEEAAVSSDRTIDRFPFRIGFRLEGQEAWRQGQMVSLSLQSPNYLRMLNQPVLRGRGLSEDDRRGAPAAAVVNQSFANRYFPGDDPIGKQFAVPVEANPNWLTIVGVVPDRRDLGYKEHHGPEAYLCAYQFAPVWASTLFLVRTQPKPAVLGDALRKAIQSVDRNVPVGTPMPLDSQIERTVRRNLDGMRAIGAIGLFGLIMATIGIYGVVAFSVVDRTRELGIRMALGATRRDTLRLVVRQGLRHVLIGLAVGMALGVVTTLGIRELLYGTRPFDPSTYGAVGGIMFASSLLATLIPARRALHINPVEALRYE